MNQSQNTPTRKRCEILTVGLTAMNLLMFFILFSLLMATSCGKKDEDKGTLLPMVDGHDERYLQWLDEALKERVNYK